MYRRCEPAEPSGACKSPGLLAPRELIGVVKADIKATGTGCGKRRPGNWAAAVGGEHLASAWQGAK